MKRKLGSEVSELDYDEVLMQFLSAITTPNRDAIMQLRVAHTHVIWYTSF